MTIIESAAQTIDNPRGRGVGLEGGEGLPLWMTCEQKVGDPTSKLGYVPAIEILYVLPGSGSEIYDLLTIASIPNQFEGMDFTLDRYLINGYGIQHDSDSIVVEPVTTFDDTYDTGLVYSYIMYFYVDHDTATFTIPLETNLIGSVSGVRIIHNNVIRDVVDLSIDHDQFVIHEQLYTTDSILVTVFHNGQGTVFGGSDNSGSDALVDDSKYYKFPNDD